jgi:Xaa-Pro aminopeptidase
MIGARGTFILWYKKDRSNMKLTQVDFQERRDRLAAQMGPNSIAIIATSPVAMRNRDADYKYRTDSSFFI